MTQSSAGEDWPATMFRLMADSGVDLFAYVPDAGNKRLIECADASNEARTVLLTTEEEGLAICAGADLVGKRAVLCMQSSGLGNCVNYLSLVNGGKFPLLMMLSMLLMMMLTMMLTMTTMTTTMTTMLTELLFLSLES